MSILIKGMEMPPNCTECRFACDGWCYAKEPTEPNSKSLATGTRPSWCPLIEIPPHGDLIDRDSVLEILSDKNAAWDGYVKVKALPIVVESEEEDDSRRMEAKKSAN